MSEQSAQDCHASSLNNSVVPSLFNIQFCCVWP